jgi:transposase
MKDREERIARTVELRSRGFSLRSIAAALGGSYGTVRRDLERWERQEVAHLLADARVSSEPSQVRDSEGEPE